MLDSPPRPAGSDGLVDTATAAAYLGLAPMTLCKLRTTGGGPPFLRLTPKAVRYRMEDVRQWALNQQHRHTAEYKRAG